MLQTIEIKNKVDDVVMESIEEKEEGINEKETETPKTVKKKAIRKAQKKVVHKKDVKAKTKKVVKRKAQPEKAQTMGRDEKHMKATKV